jgi:serine protease
MKRIFLVLITTLLCYTTFSQNVFKDYSDGKLYVKLSKPAAKTISNENPKNIPLNKLKVFGELFNKYAVTRVYKPFYQAIDDRNLPSILKIEFKNASAVSEFIKDLETNKDVEYAEKVPLMKTDITPNDPTFPSHLTQINAQNAWNVFNGSSNITLAIVDNAVMWTHQDLVANTYTNTGEIPSNGIDDDANGYVDDVNGWDVADGDNNAIPTNTLMDHGTHCAGIAGARTDNSLGIASIGWNIKIIPVKTTSNGSSTSSIDDGYGGIVYAANAGARVISCSWGGGGSSQSEQNVINYAWNRGCIVVAAAGNANTNAQLYPGAYANVYCVASVGSGNNKSGFSNYGTWVDIAAPGEAIYSTIPSASLGTYGFKSGTSMATPLVAGLSALMLSKCPFMTQTNVLNCISSTAVNIYTLAANATFSAGNQLGAGRIEAFQAMNCAASYSTTPPVANFFAFPLNTCPNTPVTFYDSSLYIAPGTTRSWTFQTGSPANATTSNVSVQWSTIGTYSAALTVSNTNGSNTKTKQTYITVAGPIALPLQEGFQSTSFLPTNWTPNNVYNDNIYWTRVTGIGGYGTSTACAVFDNYNIDAIGQRDEMRTPKYIFTNVASARLRFDVAFARYNSFFSDSLEVKLSTNCGATWTSIYLKGGTNLATASDLSANTFTPTNAQWRTDSIDISTLTAGQGNVMFSFINRGRYGQALYLDNINLAFPTPTLNATLPSSVCAGSSFSINNTSLGAATYTWSFPGGTPLTSTLAAPSASYASPGIYTVTLLGLNGTTTTTATRTINIAALPPVSVNSPTICSGSVATLTATGATNYTWTGNPAGPTLAVSPVVTTIYTVTGNNGSCSAIRTATVLVNANPTITVNSPTICSGNSAVLTPTGAINYTWTTGTSTLLTTVISPTPATTVVYSIIGNNNLCSAVQTATIFVNASPTLSINSPTICSGNSAVLTPTGASNYTWTSGTGTLFTSIITPTPASTTVFNVIGSNGFCAASQNATVFVNPTPTLTAANQTICTGTTGTLTVSGANTYLWNTGATTNSILSNPTGNVSYTVIGTSIGCSSSRTLIAFSENTPSLSLSANTTSLCAGSSATLTVNGASSYLWSTGSTSTNVVVSPTASGTFSVMGTNVTCTATVSSPLFVISAPSLSLSANPPLPFFCVGNTATLIAQGVYNNITWSTGQTNSTVVSPTITSTYTVQASNYQNTGCSTSSLVTIIANANPISVVSTSNANCTNPCSGIATATTSGGTAPFTYNLSGGNCNTIPCANLCAGNYTLSTKNAEGCTSQTLFSISAPANTMSLSTATANSSCSNCATGSATVSINGGLAPFSYSWTPNAVASAINTALLPRCYTVSVVDANKCTAQTSLCVGFDLSSGINNFLNQTNLLSIYPNPAIDAVTIDFKGVMFDCSIYNNLGQLVIEKSNSQDLTSINLENIAKGVYILQIKYGKEIVNKKLVVE